ncbi:MULTISPECIES: glycosyltransferase [unclassified Anabaena]|uniref:glycosyltransferase n=1 Tax=unclassified Anabaena TaxID=2619674 RepID=UPI0039C72109
MSDILLNPIVNNPFTQTTVRLQNIILPNLDICTTEELFLRLNTKSVLNYEYSHIELKNSGVISFDTYFNAFSVQKWLDYTRVKNIGLNLTLQGKFKISLFNIDYAAQVKKLVNQKVINNHDLAEYNVFSNIDISLYKGLLYVEIEALANNCIFQNGYFYANITQTQNLDQKIAIVICTYKREYYINKNIELIDNYLFKQSNIGNKFEIFIIDNGRTLKNIYGSQIHVIHNKNAGGSGGYTRGMLEVLDRKSDFSHIILMDDDVVIAPEVFERIYNFQNVASDANFCFGGSMLLLDNQYIQHENGAIWDQEVIRIKPDLDLRNINNVLFNEIEEYINYNGWWLFCFPTRLIDNSKLPYPFFIKMDDMEFPRRLNHKIITLNGVCVWHEALEKKYSAMMNYYLKKNELILNVITTDNFSKLDAIKYFVKFTMREAFCYKYKSADVVFQAVADFLKGPEYLKTLDPEEKNLEIRSMGEKAVKNHQLPFIYGKYQESLNETENTFYRWFRLFTLNGHLLPSIFFHKNNKLTQQKYKIISMQKYRPINVFRSKTALYHNLNNAEGFAVDISREEFFKIFIKIIFLSIQIFFKFPQIKRKYRDTLPELTNRNFWESYLEINKYSS